MTTRNKEQAELAAAIAEVGPRGRSLFVPSDPETARASIARLRAQATTRRTITEQLIQARTADPDLFERSRQRVLNQLASGATRAKRGAIAA